MLDDGSIRKAFEKLGAELQLQRDVEILVVGGAAGVLTGELPAAWTTADVDVLHCQLPRDREAVLDAAADVARAFSLPPSWLSEDVGLFAWTLPSGWETRRVAVGVWGRLHVYAVGRLDLIAMKFIAHRAGDLEHLAQLKVMAADLRFVSAYLDILETTHPEENGRIEMARQYVSGWVTE